MLIKPDIKDEKIIICLQDNYGLDVENISFLPLGADFNTVVYKVVTSNKENYFLKLRSGEFLDASVSVPKYLLDAGIKQIILPITTKDGQLFSNFADFKTILYPYIDTCNATQIKLTKAQWVLLGKAIKKLHELDISPSITKNVSKENYSSKWRESLKELLVHISNKNFSEPVASEMSQFIKSKTNEIIKLIQCAEELVTKLQKQQLEHVLCHADLHGWNLIIDKEGNFYIVDWDTLIFAPKERDLMFIGAGIWDSSLTPNEEESLFYQGYAPSNINQDALAYYRFERIIQDISDYCEYVFLSDEGSKEDRRQCFEYLKSNFLEGGTIERAYKAYELTNF